MTKKGSLKDKPALSGGQGKSGTASSRPLAQFRRDPDMDLALFVYGSLQPGGEYWPRFVKDGSSSSSAVCPGHYINARGYLATPNSKTRIRTSKARPGSRLGCWLPKTKTLYITLMGFEGYDPARPAENTITRVRIDCFDDDDSATPHYRPVWIYTMNPAQLACAAR